MYDKSFVLERFDFQYLNLLKGNEHCKYKCVYAN